MGFGLLAAADEALGHADVRVSGGEIAVDRERSLEFGNALRGPIGVNLNDAKTQMRQRLFWRDRQRLDRKRFGRRQARGPVIAHVRPMRTRFPRERRRR